MPLPIPVLTEITKIADIMSDLVKSQHQTDQARLSVQLQAHLGSLQQEYALAKLDADKEVTLIKLSIAKHVFDKKIEHLSTAFNLVHEMIVRNQAELFDEQRRLKDRRFDASLPQNERLRIDARLNQVSDMLLDLNAASRNLADNFGDRVHSMNPLP